MNTGIIFNSALSNKLRYQDKQLAFSAVQSPNIQIDCDIVQFVRFSLTLLGHLYFCDSTIRPWCFWVTGWDSAPLICLEVIGIHSRFHKAEPHFLTAKLHNQRMRTARGPGRSRFHATDHAMVPNLTLTQTQIIGAALLLLLPSQLQVERGEWFRFPFMMQAPNHHLCLPKQQRWRLPGWTRVLPL